MSKEIYVKFKSKSNFGFWIGRCKKHYEERKEKYDPESYDIVFMEDKK